MFSVCRSATFGSPFPSPLNLPDSFWSFPRRLSLSVFERIFRDTSTEAPLWKLLTQQRRPHPCFDPFSPYSGKQTCDRITVAVDVF